MAAGNGHLNVLTMLKKLIESDSTLFTNLLNGRNESLNTPLHWASLNNQVKCVEFLIESQADTGVKNAENQTALEMVLDLGLYEIAVR